MPVSPPASAMRVLRSGPSETSAPMQNAFSPVADRIAHQMSASALILCHAAYSNSSISPVIAFIPLSRFRRTWATLPTTWNSTSAINSLPTGLCEYLLRTGPRETGQYRLEAKRRDVLPQRQDRRLQMEDGVAFRDGVHRSEKALRLHRPVDRELLHGEDRRRDQRHAFGQRLGARNQPEIGRAHV